MDIQKRLRSFRPAAQPIVLVYAGINEMLRQVTDFISAIMKNEIRNEMLMEIGKI